MNIVMFTNTFTPHVGGVANSVSAFAAEFRQRGHRVLVVAPEFADAPADDDCVRVTAIQRFNGSDFSLPVPLPRAFDTRLHDFGPELVHAHHPFLLGDTALRCAANWNTPIVFTHHTQYEKYTHYTPADSTLLKRFVAELAVGYCDLCDAVIAPSETIADGLARQGTHTPVHVIPTGVDIDRFAAGDASAIRRELGLNDNDLVVGHVGRLAPEKNLGLLARAVASFVASEHRAHFLVVGDGPSRGEIEQAFANRDVADRLHLLGRATGQRLVDAYHAMDVFVFASQTETQGMVLTEAMAAGVPVIAVDAAGVREVMVDGRNGRLLQQEDEQAMVAALAEFASLAPEKRERLRAGAKSTAEKFSMERSADRALALYQKLHAAGRRTRDESDSLWQTALRRIDQEWNILTNVAQSVTTAVGRTIMGDRET